DEVFRSENGKGPWGRERARERYGGPLLSTGTSRAQGDEGSRKDLAGDGRTHGTGIRREPGEGSTESARPINTQFPAPPPPGQGNIRVAGRCTSQRAGLEGCRKAGPMLCRAALPPKRRWRADAGASW